MSVIQKETIEVTAQSIGITNLSQDAALALAPDVEYRLREIMQEAIKCMRHSKRNLLTVDDVDSALKLRNVEPVYGFASGDPLRFRRALGHKDLFYVDDKDVDLKDVIEAPLPKAPLDTSVVCHWLAIEGVQPAIPENAPVKVIGPPETKQLEPKEDGLPVDIKLPVKHVLSRELQLYFDKVTELTVSKSDSALFKEALVSLATDSGLHPLVPYFTCFIADEVARGLSSFPLLFALMRLVCSLLRNPHIHVEPYLHQLMPSVVTCLVAKRLGNRLADNHWELRDFTATIIASICRRFAHVYNSLQTRLTKTLLSAFLDTKRALPQHYGAIQGLAALGPNVVRLLILPNLETYLRLLEPEMLLETQKNEIKRHEAWRVYGALLSAAGKCIYDKLKIFPILPSPLARNVRKSNARIVDSRGSYKCKRPDVPLEEQPPLKKNENHGSVVQLPNNSAEMEIERNTAPSGESGSASSHAQEIEDVPLKSNSSEMEIGQNAASLGDSGAGSSRAQETQTVSSKNNSSEMETEQNAAPLGDSGSGSLRAQEIEGVASKNNSTEMEIEQNAAPISDPGVGSSRAQAIQVVSSKNNSSEIETEQNAVPSGDSGAGSSHAQRVEDVLSRKRQRKQMADKQSLSTRVLLDRAWKDDLDSGRLLVNLFELFGESIFPFIATPEMALFL
ncbi:OLC1v1024953C1 [Oldenlandia corymbosa var. corymbosa]|uniref:OLC1v1024953C1 n=1 Tax=Oldenlandia corymbosa var. corymbosa TaxID=529605 RepID=A0AAV1C5R0_OLDCO|nr:OLC1v1024953C1 [Oldenlandia corymbosa var. corymbosa]